MRFSQLGAAAALGAVTQAFLIPPTISVKDSEVVNTLPFDTAQDIEGRIIEVKCPGCPVRVTNLEGQAKYNTAPVLSKLRFNFSLSHGEERDTLILNGLQVYPLTQIFDHTSQGPKVTLSADQFIQTPEGKWAYVSTPTLGHALTSGTTAVSDKDQMELSYVNLQVLQIEDKCMSKFPTIEVKLLETPTGKLMIGDVAMTKNTHENPFCPVGPVGHTGEGLFSAPPRPISQCTSILCEWRAAIAEKVSKMKGCGGKRPEKTSGMRLTYHGHSRPRPHGPHRPHRHHHRHGGFAKFVRSIVFHVFIPIMIGVVVGITASLVGMIVGHIAIFIWRVLFRRGQRTEYHRVQQEAKDGDDESKSFAEHENPPPVYEDAPAYEEAVVEKD